MHRILVPLDRIVKQPTDDFERPGYRETKVLE